MVLIAFWVVPFPLAVFFGSKLQYTCNISPNEFFVILFCPPTSVFFYLRARLSQYRRTIKRPDAILAKHMLMTLYESFRLQKVDKRFDVMWYVARHSFLHSFNLSLTHSLNSLNHSFIYSRDLGLSHSFMVCRHCF